MTRSPDPNHQIHPCLKIVHAQHHLHPNSDGLDLISCIHMTDEWQACEGITVCKQKPKVKPAQAKRSRRRPLSYSSTKNVQITDAGTTPHRTRGKLPYVSPFSKAPTVPIPYALISPYPTLRLRDGDRSIGGPHAPKLAVRKNLLSQGDSSLRRSMYDTWPLVRLRLSVEASSLSILSTLSLPTINEVPVFSSLFPSLSTHCIFSETHQTEIEIEMARFYTDERDDLNRIVSSCIWWFLRLLRGFWRGTVGFFDFSRSLLAEIEQRVGFRVQFEEIGGFDPSICKLKFFCQKQTIPPKISCFFS